MHIREASDKDYDALWEIFSWVIQTGDTFVFSPQTPKEDLSKYWLAPSMRTYVLEDGHQILGSYFIKPNQVDLGSHVANCGYMVHPDARGKGIGGLLCEHSIQTAKQLGYLALQYNIVVSTNQAAVRLWKKHGFEIIGTIPKAFNHQSLGYVDAYVMFREL